MIRRVASLLVVNLDSPERNVTPKWMQMDSDLQQSMLAYYNERAPEYEELYTVGKCSASIPDPNVFKAETALLADIVREFASDRLMDLACGTAYWLPSYASQCSRVTFFDQSKQMLAECQKKVEDLDIADTCTVLRGNFFAYEFDRSAYDCALVGFFLSHLTQSQERYLFDTLRHMLDSSGRFLIVDSAWSKARATSHRKVERELRRLNDGRSFEIYKKYCDREDISAWAGKYGVDIRIEHFETAFYAVSGSFKRV